MKKKNICIVGLLSLIILSILLRYPATPHQNLYDSTNYHYMTTLVSMHGRALWNLNPLSLLGFYPLAYTPMGGIYLYSGVTQLTGVHFEESIIIINGISAIIMCLGSFLLGRKLFHNNYAGLFTSFLFISGRNTISLTTFTAIVRGIPCSFLPLIFLLLISSYEYRIKLALRKKFFLLFLFMFITMLATHRLTYLFLPVVLIYPLFQIFGSKISSNISPKFRRFEVNRNLSPKIIKLILFPIIFLIVVIFSITNADMFFGRTVFLTESAFISGTSISVKVINLFYHISRKMGLGIIFGIIGLLVLSYKRKSHSELFLFFGMLSFIPFSIRLAYVYPIWTLFFSLFGGLGIFYLLTKIDTYKLLKTIKIIGITFLLLSIIIAPYFITITEPYKTDKARENYVTDREVITATYLKHNLDDKEGFYVDPIWQAQVFVGISEKQSIGLAGVEYAAFNETMRNNLEVKSKYSSEKLTLINFLEIFHEEKGNLYIVTKDPLFNNLKYWRAGHRRYFSERFKTERYHMIVKAYNIKTIVFDNRHIDQNQMYVKLLNESEYIIYNTKAYHMYPVSY